MNPQHLLSRQVIGCPAARPHSVQGSGSETPWDTGCAGLVRGLRFETVKLSIHTYESGGTMYQKPTLKRFGSFRELTLMFADVYVNGRS